MILQMQGGGSTSAGGSSSSSVDLSGPVGHISLAGSSQPDVDALGRRRCWLHDGELMPSYPTSATITSSFKKYLHPGGYTWKIVPPERRQAYRKEFRNEWFWDPTLEDGIWAAWEIRAPQRYKDMVHYFKKDRTKGCPPFMPPEMWDGFKVHWDSDAFKKKSAIASKNRLSEPDGPGTDIVKHRGGSRSAVAHAAALAMEKGVQPNDVAWETFRRLHDNPDGSHTDPISARIAADVFARVEELSQPTPNTDEAPPPVDMSVVYVDAARRHSKKNRVFGLGSRSRSYSTPSVLSAAPPQPDTQAAIRALQEQMEAQQAALRHQMDAQAALLQAQQEKIDQQQEMIRQQAEMFELMRAQFRGPPPS
ncbi:hypothetical protein C2S51_012677 [Perilla frutescens var. frutescens]|nr:hypothetical protein C2S51_012677 [Perilla frutescens var. frutescens]